MIRHVEDGFPDPAMDLLTDVLQQAGLQRRLLDLQALAPAGALRFPCDRSMGFHVVTSGHVHLHADALAEPVLLQAGDIAFMARGCPHVLSTEARLPAGEIPRAGMTPVGDAPPAPAPGAAAAAVVSAAYQLWHPPLHPLFAELPDWRVLRADRQPRLGPLALSLSLLAGELAQPDAGSPTIVNALMDAAFAYLMRQLLAPDEAAAAGFRQAVQHPKVRAAVALMHADTARDWTLDALAQQVGLSRTGLATQFRRAMGDTPLNYLRLLRMQRAVRLLGDTDQALDRIATAVGYQDAFSFSKVFKRTVGLAPRDFRRQDAADRAVPWRL